MASGKPALFRRSNPALRTGSRTTSAFVCQFGRSRLRPRHTSEANLFRQEPQPPRIPEVIFDQFLGSSFALGGQTQFSAAIVCLITANRFIHCRKMHQTPARERLPDSLSDSSLNARLLRVDFCQTRDCNNLFLCSLIERMDCLTRTR